MAGTMQQEEQKITFPEIRDIDDGYAEAPEDIEGADGIDVNIEDMVWEVDTEPAENIYESQDMYQSGPQEMPAYERENWGYYNHREPVYEEIPYSRKCNKHIFTWILSFVCGIYGVDRFVRGQIPLGILKLLSCGGFGFWYAADLGIAIYKSYFEDGAEEQEDLHFDSAGRYV